MQKSQKMVKAQHHQYQQQQMLVKFLEPHMFQQIQIKLLGINESFGEEEFFRGVTRQISISCVSASGVLVTISKSNFYEKFGQKQDILKYLENLSLQKLDQRINLIESVIGSGKYLVIKSRPICEDV